MPLANRVRPPEIDQALGICARQALEANPSEVPIAEGPAARLPVAAVDFRAEPTDRDARRTILESFCYHKRLCRWKHKQARTELAHSVLHHLPARRWMLVIRGITNAREV